MLEFLKNHDAGTFSHDEAIAIFIPRAARAGRVVVACRECAHCRESTDTHGSDRGFGASGNHYVGIAISNDAHGIANGVSAGSAGGSRRFVRALGAESHGNVPGGKVDDGSGDEEWRDLARAAFEKRLVLALDYVETANAGADVDAHLLGILGSNFEFRHLHRFIGRGEREVDEAAHLLDFFFLDEIERVEIAYFGSDLAGECGGVKCGNAVHAALARRQSLPYGLCRVPE